MLNEPLYKNKDILSDLLKSGISQKKIAEQFNVHITTIERSIKKLKLEGLKYAEEPINISLMVIENPIFCYMLGLFITDGYFSGSTGRVEIDLLDEQPLRFLSKYFNCTFYDTFKTTLGKKRYRICFPNRVSYIFKNLGFKPGAKTFSLVIPDIPYYNKKFFIRGLIDGDGSIYKSTFRLFSVCLDILEYVKEYCANNNMSSSITIHSSIGYSLDITGKEGLLDIYTDYTEAAIPRKLAKAMYYDNIRNGYMLNGIPRKSSKNPIKYPKRK